MQTVARPAVAGLTLALALLAPAPPAGAQQELTLERIFASSDFRSQSLPAVHWMNDGRRFSFVRPDGDGATDLWVEDAASGRRTRVVEGRTLLPPGQERPIEIEDYQWSADERKLLIYTNSQPVWRQNTKGHYYVLDLASGRLAPVSTAPGWQQFAKLSPDGTRVGFVRDNDLFVADLAAGRETRLTRGGSETLIHGTFDWVYEEELGLQDGWRWSPDGRRIAFWQIDQEPVQTFHWINDTRGAYAETVALRYPKAGSPNPKARIGVVDAGGGEVRWMDTGSDTLYLARMEWAASPDELMIQRLNRHQNRLEVMLADAATGQARVLFADSDPAWVDVDDDLRFVNGGRQLLWTSERDGHNHVYLYARDGSLVRQLTRGPWDVTRIEAVDARGGWVYFGATEQGPTQRHLYRVKLDGSGFRRLTAEPGSHGVRMADGSGFYLDVYSRTGVPPVTRLHAAADGRAVRTLVDNARLAGQVAALGVERPEFFTFRTADGVELNGWMIRPPGFDPARKYPVLQFVYGGPGSQTVVDSWGGNRYLWHQLLAQKGYLVVSVDNRGTGGRGREFKKATYLDLGRLEAHDQIEAARWLARQPYVDAGRMGIWGWSYGGYMTALTMMQPGSPFAAGISVAPVAHWGLYDTIYTERYMRTPQENPEGYRRSAPTENAANLRGKLLLVHGTGDDNVHFQNSVQLAEKLQEAGKQFAFMAYPNRTHSISGGRTSLHLYTLMTDWLLANL